MSLIDDVDQSERLTLPSRQHVKEKKQIDESVRQLRQRENQALFDSHEIGELTKEYNIVVPARPNSKIDSSNPALYAIHNISKKGPRQIVKNPLAPMKKSTVLAPSAAFPKKPIGELAPITALVIAKQENELEAETIKFDDDPIAYFSKRKDGRGHRFIYMVYERDPDDPLFSPYELKKVPSSETGSEYFTMSATGVTHIHSNGDTDTVSLDQWARESSLFQSLRKLKFFSKYFYWKSMHFWKLFLVNQRYQGLKNKIMTNAPFENPDFFKSSLKIYFSQSDTLAMLRSHLLCFTPNKKYPIKEFEEDYTKNSDELKKKYTEFTANITNQVLQLYDRISNPKRLHVRDADFPEVRRRNPNLDQLIELERKKAEVRREKTIQVNDQIASLGNFIRVIDYMQLESLAKGCVECWQVAESNVSQEGSSVFQVEVSFSDEGSVIFKPNLEELEKAITGALDFSMKTLSTLPRVLMSSKLRALLRNGDLDINLLMDSGPQLHNFTDGEEILPQIRNTILETVRRSYNDGFFQAQSFKDFYPIYKLGQTWNIKDYVRTRSGKPYTGKIADRERSVNEDDFLVNTQDEPIVDFVRVEHDMETFKDDDHRVFILRQGMVKGAIHIDTGVLKAALAPIPKKALYDIQTLMTDLSQMKVDLTNTALSFYAKNLKQEPTTLDGFVSFCEILQRAVMVKPAIESEIKFIDQTYEMFDKFGLTHNRNPLHQKFNAFQNDISIATNIRQTHTNVFIMSLRDIITALEQKLNKYHEKASAIPAAISMIETDKAVPLAEKRLGKVKAAEESVRQAIKYQNVIGVEINKFAFFQNVLNVAEFALDLYSSVASWLKLNDLITKVPFHQIDMANFRVDVLTLTDQVKRLNGLPTATTYPILGELTSRVQDIAPFVEQLDRLSTGRMQSRHWNMLFEACEQQSNYNPKLTIEDLLKLNILKSKEKIEQITAMSQGEYELEAEFYRIANYWNKVQMPIEETGGALNEDNLLLAPTHNLLQEINDALINLSRMLTLPYVQGIRDTVQNLTSTLENISQIIEAWQLFQSNWVILSVIFSQDATRSLLPQQANRFTGVQRKWSTIARHAIKDTRLFSVCAFPSLLDVLHDNNSSMESIISSLGKLLDTKRNMMPRLYFLSNDDVLRLISATNPKDISEIAAKIFMNIDHLEISDEDGNEAELINSKVTAFVGTGGSKLQLKKAVDLDVPAEQWLTKLVDAMRDSVKEKINNSITRFENAPFDSWFVKSPIYIAAVVLQVMMTRELNTIYNPLDERTKPIEFPSLMNKRINLLVPMLENNQEAGAIIALLRAWQDRYARIVAMSRSDIFNPQLEWNDQIHFVQRGNNIFIEIADTKWEFGYEFWGKLPFFIRTHSIWRGYHVVSRAIKDFGPALINGSTACGKRQLALQLAADFGRFAYTINPFPDSNEYFIGRALIGAAITGSWAIFTHIERMSHQHLAYIYDNIRQIYDYMNAGINRIIIHTKLVELNLNTRIIFTSSTSYYTSSEFPAQLKELVRPASLANPETAHVASIKLFVLGFKNYSTITQKLEMFLTSVTNLVSNPIYPHTTAATAMKIADVAAKYVKHGVPEETAIMFTCMNMFNPVGDQGESEIISNLLFTAFQPTETKEQMLELLADVYTAEMKSRIYEMLVKEAEAMGEFLPHEYLADKAMQLLHDLKFSRCIIIVGAPETGKTTIVKMLQNVLSKSEVKEQFPAEIPIQVLDCFHGAESSERIYGHMFDDLTHGQTWAYGMIQSIINQLQRSTDSYNCIRFDGDFTQKFGTFIMSLIGAVDEGRFVLSSQDQFITKNRLKVIVEAPSISGIMPGLISKSNVIVMNNCQIPSIYGPRLTTELMKPEYPFKKALEITGHPENTGLLQELFMDMAPKVVKHVFHSQNIIFYSEDNPKMEYGNIYMSVTLPTFVAVLAIRMLSKFEVNYLDKLQVSQCLALAFDRIYSAILNPKERPLFDDWLCTQTDIVIPNDWVGYNVPDVFWSMYNKPCLAALQIFQGHLIPLNFQSLEEKPIYQTRSEGKLPLFPSEVLVNNAQILNPTTTAELLLEYKHSFIVHGPPGCGKSSFLKRLFAMNDNILPIYVQASDLLQTENAVSFLYAHSPYLSKVLTPTTQGKQIILVIENLKPEHEHLIEFLRMIETNHKISAFSTIDPKVYESLTMMSFLTIITTDCLPQLPLRLTQRYVPITLDPITSLTASTIARKILITYDMPDSTATSLTRFALSLLGQFPEDDKALTLINSIFTLCHYDQREDLSSCITLMLHELTTRIMHHYPSKDIHDKINFVSRNECYSDAEKLAASEYADPKAFMYPTYDLSKDMKQFNIRIERMSNDDMMDKIQHQLALFNANATEKVALHLSRDINHTYALIYSAMQCPGVNVVMTSPSGSGKYTMTRLIAHACECDFIHIAPPTAEELLAPDDRIYALTSVVREAITNAALHQKRSIIFTRWNPQSMSEMNALINFAVNGDYTPFFSKNGLEDLYIRFTNIHALTFEHRLTAMRQIKNMLKVYIRVVIAANQPIPKSVNLNGFVMIELHHDNQESYTQFASESVEQAATKKLIRMMGLQVSKMIGQLSQTIKKYTKRLPENMMYDFIDTFSHFAAADYQDLNTKNENIQSALSFVSKLEVESRTIDRRLDQLAPTLQRLQVDSESLQSSYSTRKEAIDNRQQKLLEDKKAKVQEVDQMKDELDIVDNQIAEIEPKLQAALKEVEALTKNDIETIRISAGDPMPSMRLLLEVFCLFLDLPPSYERSGQKLLMDPKFIEILTSRIGKDPIQPKMLENVLPYFEQESLNPTELEAIAPALVLLYDWVNLICQHAQLAEKHQSLKRVLTEKEKHLHAYIEEMDTELASIEQVSTSLENELKNLQASKASREQMEKDYKAVDARKRVIDSIYKEINHFVEKWQTDVREFTSRKEKLIGNAVLFSFFLVFHGMVPPEQRDAAIGSIMEDLHSAGIEHSSDSFKDYVLERFMLINPDMYHTRPDTLGPLDFALDMHHVMTTLRTPLLVDPDGMATAIIRNDFKNRIIAISAYCSMIDIIAAQAVSEGKILFIYDVLFLPSVVSSLMPLDVINYDPNGNHEVRVGGKLVLWDPNFKIILSSPCSDVNKLPDSLISRVNVIDVTASSLEAAKTVIRHTFASFFHPESTNKAAAVYKAEVMKKVTVIQRERDVLDILADIVATQSANPNYDYLADQETIDELLKAKEEYFTSLNMVVDVQPREDFNAQMKSFKQFITQCHTFWLVVSRMMTKVTFGAEFAFNAYQQVIQSVLVNDGFRQGNLTPEQALHLKGSLNQASFAHFLSAMTSDEATFFMFLVAHNIRSANDRRVNTDLKAVLEHIKNESESPVSFAKETGQKYQTDTLEKLKYTSMTNFFGYLSRFIADQFGPDFLSMMPEFTSDRVITNSASVPSLIITAPWISPANIVHHIVTQRSRLENFESITFSDDLELIKNTKKVITMATSRGNWIIVQVHKRTKAVSQILADIHQQMTTSSINTNFRLIIICSIPEILPASLVTRSKRTVIDTLPSMRSTMQTLFNQHASLVTSTKNAHAMKRMLYVVAAVCAFAMYRRIFRPNGFHFDVMPTMVAYADAGRRLRRYVDQGLDPAPFDNLRSVVMNTLFPSVQDHHDFQIVRQLVNTFISEKVTANVGTTLTLGTTDIANWIIPGDVPLPHFASQIQRIPPFPKVDVLGMDPRMATMRSWLLSRIASRPFVMFHSELRVTNQALLSQLEDILSTLPTPIGVGDSESKNSPYDVFIMDEVKTLNRALYHIKKDLKRSIQTLKAGAVDEVAHRIAEDKVPARWKQLLHVYTSVHPASFVSFLRGTKVLRAQWAKEGISPVINTQLVGSLKRLLFAHFASEVARQKIPASEASVSFELLGEQAPPEEGQLLLVGAHMMLGRDVSGLLCRPDKSAESPFHPVAAIRVSVGSQKPEGNFAVCIYEEARVDTSDVAFEDRLVHEGHSANFVADVRIKTDDAVVYFVVNGTAIYCRLADQLIESK